MASDAGDETDRQVCCVDDAGFSGDNCQVNVDDCVRHRCANRATCVDGVDDYTCTCPPHWTGMYIPVRLVTHLALARL